MMKENFERMTIEEKASLYNTTLKVLGELERMTTTAENLKEEYAEKATESKDRFWLNSAEEKRLELASLEIIVDVIIRNL